MSGVRRVVVLALLLGAGLLCVASCASLDKDALEARLLALPKNAPVAAHGLVHEVLPLEIGGRPRDVEVTRLSVSRVGAPAPGEGVRRPVVFVHGTPGTLFTWTAAVFGGRDDEGAFEGIARDFDVEAFDVIGHGTTRTELGQGSFQRCADMLASTLRALDLGPVHLVGQSYGGEFVWRAALDHPEFVASVTLVDSAGLARADDEWLPEEEAMRELPGARLGYLLNARDRVASALQPHFRETVDADRVEEMFLCCENADNWGVMVDLARDENGTREPELPSLRVPVLLLWGADDVAYTVERFARRFEVLLPDVRLVQLADCGHYPQEERPRAFVEALRTFLLEVEAGG
ncbi:MAG: alpha/beta hydrolase [Planctomycetes bacterium]|nr:alpha/beta hydrolase [Planctomycetota bacterium]